LGFPAFYTPYISIPDPSTNRAVGFLAPEFLSNSRLDFGVKLPFFIPLDVDKDVTITTFLTPQTNTIETRYRQAFSKGNLFVDSALTRDTLGEHQFRGYLSVDGEFNLENGYILNYAVERVSDSAYLGDYGYSARNELSSGLNYSKVKQDRFFETSLGVIQSLYTEDKDNLTLTTNYYYDRTFGQIIIPGSLSFTSELLGSWRKGSEDIIGRDRARFGNQLNWRNSKISQWGLEYGGGLNLRQDVFLAIDDSRLNDFESLNSIGANTYFRLPLSSVSDKATHLLEPMAQIAWGKRKEAIVYIDESLNTEFDMGNLISNSRFSASDQFETGFHGAYGLRYNYHTNKNIPAGGFALGQVVRLSEEPGFSSSSGLGGTQSDIFLAAELFLPYASYVSFQGLLDNKSHAKKTDFNTGFEYKSVHLDIKYSFLQSDDREYRLNPIEEWTMSTGYEINNNWQLNSNVRYDETESHLAMLGAGLSYQNQCVMLNLEMDRRYSLEGTSLPTTNFSFAIRLKGFSTGGTTNIIEKSCK
jgi:LPS-assembly protein